MTAPATPAPMCPPAEAAEEIAATGPAGQTLVMRLLYLPGMNGSGSFWAPVAEHLPPSHDHVMVDWPGLGPVPASDDVRCLGDLARHARARLGEPTAVIAQSMGGAVALRLALDPSAMVTHLVLCATSGGLDMAALGASDWRDAYKVRWPKAPEWAFEPLGDISDELTALEVPTLLLWASDDPVSPVAVGRHLASLLPRATLRVLQANDHAFAGTHPGEVAALIAEHLAVP